MIVAFCNNRGIGFKNTIPWKLKSDLKYFKKITIGKGNNAVIMGSSTFKSIPYKNNFYNRLPKRDNLILSKRLQNNNIFNNINSLKIHCQEKKYDEIWIIGGESVYNSFINDIDELYVTRIFKNYQCDTFFPNIPSKFKLIDYSDNLNENGIDYRYEIYKNLKIK